ncbi:uncharacterized protein DUF3293 [Neolewinella xylanilytica]|uniref:Uncharacterized protein DUF3293 n=1 Tax=Neolewinella xylanilytica TaxID=1514080 RepID=A0A2S6IBQ5_9BACT|nr:DUF3293 domain-containing protein [Neolewinella xylanilytica]PPK88879.1 uncharacterized protein DUF3293 [Neolewinella xylanilytica]
MSLTSPDEQNGLPDERLARAYREADYRVNDTVLRIDEPHPDFDRLLSERQCTYYFFLTAFNPRSTKLPPSVNEARHRTLLTLVAGRGWAYLSASGADPKNDWEEETGLCLLDPPREEALEVARLYEQHAIVEGRRGATPVLTWL